jgi:tetratricopeptide (TPR) repeat protein
MIVESTAPHTARELCSHGRALIERGMIGEAAQQFRQALSIWPHFPDALLYLGHCLHTLSLYDEALSVYDRLTTLAPDSVPGWNNRGNTLLEMCRYEEAATSYSRALALAPVLHDARVALATCYQALGLVDEALTTCDTVLAAAPDHAEAHWNRSLLLLLKGEYEEGWREYEWRWRKRNFTSPLRNFPQPRWNGEPLEGRTLLVHAEQGFGDTLQFCRYVPLTAAQGAKVIFECHPPLAALMGTLQPTVKVVPLGSSLPHFDLHVPLLSLPMILSLIHI